jgi:hypothetical protein
MKWKRAGNYLFPSPQHAELTAFVPLLDDSTTQLFDDLCYSTLGSSYKTMQV